MHISPRGVICALSVTVLLGLLLACGAVKPPANVADKDYGPPIRDKEEGPPKSNEPTDLKLTTLDTESKQLLSCMLWADNTGNAFFVADAAQAVLYRYSGADYKTKQTTNLGVKPTWLSLSATGLVLTVADRNEIRVLDPNNPSIAKKTIAIPKLKRAVSVPSLSIAVASTDTFKSELIVVNLQTGDLTPIAPPAALGNLGYGTEVMMSPDGQNVYTNALSGVIVRWALAGNMLTYGEKGPRMHGGSPYPIVVSSDSRYVAQPNAAGNPDTGNNYCTSILLANLQRQCILEIGSHPKPLGFDVANNVIYTGTMDRPLISFDLGSGVKKKEYAKFGKGEPRQFLVHPAGKKFIELQQDFGGPGTLTYVEVLK